MSYGVLWPAYHLGSILSADSNNDGILISGGESQDVCIWDLANRSLIHQLQGFPAEITAVCLTKNSSDFFWIGCDCDLMKFDLRKFSEPVQTLSFFDDDINMITLNASETMLAACDDSGNVIVVDHTKKHSSLMHDFNEHDSCVSAIEFSPNLSEVELFSSGTDAQLRCWNLNAGSCSDVIFLADCFAGDSAAQADEFGDSEMESNMATANVLTPPMVHSISANQAGTLLACGVENSGLLLFDIRTQFKFKTRALLMGHTASVCQVVFPKFLPSVSGVEGQDLLISGGNDKKIISWRCYTDHLPEYSDVLESCHPKSSFDEQPSCSSQSQGRTTQEEEPMESCGHGSNLYPSNAAGTESTSANDIINTEMTNLPASPPLPPVKFDQIRCFNHHNKINWFCCASNVKNVQPQLIVADLSSVLSSYPLDSIFS